MFLAIVTAVLATIAGQLAFAANTTATTLAVTSSGTAATSVASGAVITLIATVASAGTAVTPGSVIFCDTSLDPSCGPLAVVGAAQLTTGGTASIAVRLGIGSHSLKAIFSGTNSYSGSASAASSLAVTGKYGSVTAISSVPEAIPGVYDLTATVYGFGPLTLNGPTGTVNFVDSSAPTSQLASLPLTGGATTQSLGFINSSSPSAPGMIASSVLIGDLNGDGKPDIAVDNVANNTGQIFSGLGDGTFQTGTSVALGPGESLVALGDLNSDGRLDLVAINETTGTISVFLGNGDGTFQAPTTYGTGTSPVAAAVGDFNGDGNPDLIAAVGSGISILLGNGDGTFQSQQTYAIDGVTYTLETVSVMPQSVSVGDFNGDGKLDVVTANLGAPQETSQSDSVSVLLGNGDGTFQSPVSYTTQQESSAVTIGDFNGDGKLDLAVSNVSSANYSETASSVSVLIDNGDGTFQPPLHIICLLTPSLTPSMQATSMAMQRLI